MKVCKYCNNFISNKMIRKHEKDCLRKLKIEKWDNVSKEEKAKRKKKYLDEARQLLEGFK